MGVRTMKIEDQVCSLELAKKLEKLRVRQESYFVWPKRPHDEYELLHFNAKSTYKDNYFSAFTSAELGELLPNSILLSKAEPFNHFRIKINKFISVPKKDVLVNNWIINYECDTTSEPLLFTKLTKNIYDPNLANAMAKMLIYLNENKLLKIK